MFTGIVQALGTVRSLGTGAQGARLSLDPGLAWRPEPGESIAVNGCCLTVLPPSPLPGSGVTSLFSFDLSLETLQRSSLGRLKAGDTVNLERALRAGDALGGHLVAGHVDGLASLDKVEPQAEGSLWRLTAPAALARFIADKGSLSLDGVSLTPFDVAGSSFSVALIPHTLQASTLGSRRPGDQLNLEVDQVARYLGRLLEAR